MLLIAESAEFIRAEYVKSRFSKEIYKFAQRYAKDIERHSMARLHVVIAITKAIMDVEISKQSLCRSNFESLLSMVDDDKNFQLSNQSKLIAALFKALSTSRIEILIDKPENLIIESENNFKKFKAGYFLENDEKNLHFKLKSENDLELNLQILSKHFSGMKQPLKIDYTNFSINGENILTDKRISASREKPIIVPLHLISGNIYEINLTWDIHGYSVDEFVSLAIEFLNG